MRLAGIGDRPSNTLTVKVRPGLCLRVTGELWGPGPFGNDADSKIVWPRDFISALRV